MSPHLIFIKSVNPNCIIAVQLLILIGSYYIISLFYTTIIFLFILC